MDFILAVSLFCDMAIIDAEIIVFARMITLNISVL